MVTPFELDVPTVSVID